MYTLLPVGDSSTEIQLSQSTGLTSSRVPMGTVVLSKSANKQMHALSYLCQELLPAARLRVTHLLLLTARAVS